MKRPMLCWVCLFVLGELLCRWIPIKGLGCVWMLCASLFLVCRKGRHFLCLAQYEGILWIGLFCVLWGICTMQIFEEQRKWIEACEGKNVIFVGTVVEEKDCFQGTEYILKIRQLVVDGEKRWVKLKLRIVNKEGSKWSLSEKLVGEGSITLFSGATNPGGFDQRSYQYGKGVFADLEDVKIETEEPPVFPVMERLRIFRERMCNTYEILLGESYASLAKAMVLGDKENLDPEWKALYQKNGIAHLIAISGLHIAMIGGSLYQLLRRLLGSYFFAASVGIGVILSYGVMTGLSGATLRAVIMLLLSMGADLCGRRYDLITAMAVALGLMVLANPYQLTQAGFQLSFGAVLGIGWVLPGLKPLFSKLPYWMNGFMVSVSVQIMLTPVMLYHFYSIPVYGVFLNILVVPLMSVLLPVLIAGGLTGMLSIPTGTYMILPGKWILYLYQCFCKASEALPVHTLNTGRPSVFWMILYYSLLVILICYLNKAGKESMRKEIRGLVFGIFLSYLGLFGSFWGTDSLVVSMFDVGQGDGIYVRTPHKKHILIDGGSSSIRNTGEYVLQKGAGYYGAGKIDFVLLSHSDSDHYSGIRELLQAGDMEIKNLILPQIMNPDEAYEELVALGRERNCNIYFFQRGDELVIDQVTFTCLNPERRVYEDKNTGSMVLHMNYGEFDMLFTGDMDCQVERELISHNCLDYSVEVLKVAHHGSATASGEEFLSCLKPQFALVSVGEKNRFGHPAKEVLQRLGNYADKIYLTKDSGAITIETDGTKYKITTYTGEKNEEY